MIRDNWRSPRFWAWWWRVRAPAAAKIGAGLVGIALLAFGGYLAADRLGGAVAASSDIEVMTVRKLVTIREQGVVVTRPVRVVQNVTVGGRTVPVTQVVHDTVTTPGNTRVVTARELRTVPVVRRKVVTVAGRARTVVVTRAGKTQPQVATVTNQRDVTTERLVTREQVVTQPVTTTRTVTQPVTTTRTVTQPVTVTQTQTQTVHDTVTTTTTLPVVTLTIQLPPLP